MGGLFGGAKMPEPLPPPPMPDDKSPAVLEARRKAAADVIARQGRESTILEQNTSGGDVSKPDNYASRTLGGR